jgi:hypothetical protein
MKNRLLLLVARFFPKLEEWLVSAIPSSLSYEPLFEHRLGLDATSRLLCVGLLATAFAGVLAASRVQKRRKALAEVLATGYHINFVEHLERVMLGAPAIEVKGSAYPVARVVLTLPRNSAELQGHLKAQGALAASGQLVRDVPYGGRTVNVRLADGQAEVHDWPRTLGSFHEYLSQEGDTDASGDVPEKYYRWFAAHLKALKRRRIGRYDRFTYANIQGQAIG